MLPPAQWGRSTRICGVRTRRGRADDAQTGRRERPYVVTRSRSEAFTLRGEQFATDVRCPKRPSAPRRPAPTSRRHRAPAGIGLDGSPAAGLPGRAGTRRAALSHRLLGSATDPTGADAADDDLAGADEEADEARQRSARRRRLTLTGLALTAVLSAVMLVVTLVTWPPDEPAARDMTSAERDRLAVMRVTNQRDLRAGLHVTIGAGTNRTDLLGWVDWARQLVYVDVGGPGAGALRGLVQASPAVLVSRPDPTAVPAPAMPPLIPPVDGWRIPRSSDSPRC